MLPIAHEQCFFLVVEPSDLVRLNSVYKILYPKTRI